MKPTLAQTLVARNQGRFKKKRTRQAKQYRELRPKRGNHSDNPKYLSGTYTEYNIQRNLSGFYIVCYGGGRVNKELSGVWKKFSDCERTLIQWLEKTDKRAQSRYPGAPKRRETNYSRIFLNVKSTSK